MLPLIQDKRKSIIANTLRQQCSVCPLRSMIMINNIISFIIHVVKWAKKKRNKKLCEKVTGGTEYPGDVKFGGIRF